MVKPPLRTKSIGFKVSEEEYARLETAAQAIGRTLGEWCREVILRGGLTEKRTTESASKSRDGKTHPTSNQGPRSPNNFEEGGTEVAEA